MADFISACSFTSVRGIIENRAKAHVRILESAYTSGLIHLSSTNDAVWKLALRVADCSRLGRGCQKLFLGRIKAANRLILLREICFPRPGKSITDPGPGARESSPVTIRVCRISRRSG